MIESRSIRYQSLADLWTLKSQLSRFDAPCCLIQVFFGVLDRSQVEPLLAELRTVFPGAAVLGASTCGEIDNAEVHNGEILISASQFRDTKVASAIVHDFSAFSDAGKQLVGQLQQPDGRAMILFCCGLLAGSTVNAEPLLDTISTLMPGLVIAGGQAGNGDDGSSTFVFTQDGLSEHGVAAALLSGEQLEVNNTYSLSWAPIGQRLTITKAQGSRVYEIDHQPPREIYSHYLGQEIADALPLAAVDFPFIIERDGMPMAVHAINVNDDGSFDYIHNFHAGEQVRFGFCHAGMLASSADVIQQVVNASQPEALFVYSCVSRKWILGSDISVELQAVSGAAPTAGFFCLGEYYTPPSRKPYLFSQTMTVLALSERSADAVRTNPEVNVTQPKPKESKQFRTLRALHHLLEASAADIESKDMELSKLGRKDTLTRLANRRAFDELLLKELNHHARSRDVFSLLLLEIDGFSGFSANSDGMAVEDSLRGIAQVMKRCLKHPGDVAARYSEQAFSCLLTEAGEASANQMAELIRRRVAALNIPNQGAPLTVSLGVLTVQGNAALSMQFVLKSVERALQQAKQGGGDQIACELAGEV